VPCNTSGYYALFSKRQSNQESYHCARSRTRTASFALAKRRACSCTRISRTIFRRLTVCLYSYFTTLQSVAVLRCVFAHHPFAHHPFAHHPRKQIHRYRHTRSRPCCLWARRSLRGSQHSLRFPHLTCTCQLNTSHTCLHSRPCTQHYTDTLCLRHYQPQRRSRPGKECKQPAPILLCTG